jgi:hypothetical protein
MSKLAKERAWHIWTAAMVGETLSSQLEKEAKRMFRTSHVVGGWIWTVIVWQLEFSLCILSKQFHYKGQLWQALSSIILFHLIHILSIPCAWVSILFKRRHLIFLLYFVHQMQLTSSDSLSFVPASQQPISTIWVSGWTPDFY